MHRALRMDFLAPRYRQSKGIDDVCLVSFFPPWLLLLQAAHEDRSIDGD